MARNIGFQENVVLADAMMVFWQKGFNGTSMRDLTAVTNLHPGSFYHSFGNKRQFFIAVSEYYYRQLTADINNKLKASDDVLQLLNDFFAEIVIGNDSSKPRGCLLVNTMLETVQDPELQGHLAAMFSGLEEMFYWLLVKGQKLQQIKVQLDCRSEAKLLVNDYFGLRVQTMTEKTSDELIQIVSLRMNHLAL